MPSADRSSQLNTKVPFKVPPTAPSKKLPPVPVTTVNMNRDEFDEEDDMMVHVILTGVVRPPPAHPKSGLRYRVGVGKS